MPKLTELSDDALLALMSEPMSWGELADWQAELDRRGLDPFEEGS